MFYEAIFQPSEKMNYNTDTKRLAGKKIAVQDGWVVKDGPYKGQNCFYIPNSTVGWIPQCDLKGLKPTSFVMWKEIFRSIGLDK
jgi:hypothetical protein